MVLPGLSPTTELPAAEGADLSLQLAPIQWRSWVPLPLQLPASVACRNNIAEINTCGGCQANPGSCLRPICQLQALLMLLHHVPACCCLSPALLATFPRPRAKKLQHLRSLHCKGLCCFLPLQHPQLHRPAPAVSRADPAEAAGPPPVSLLSFTQTLNKR
ncbi:hypothetical protein AV530_011536 [Patagioenas fasciata monilis]|uniref:Uncharacterized protein n=1 Tax=Patagioenas fasciata monilis TaxID=372326 RepID=A0A1V4JJE3_PATFA|nr:hypothetical protein AV530_011536 [Patagioenas fasciata monilis]